MTAVMHAQSSIKLTRNDNYQTPTSREQAHTEFMLLQHRPESAPGIEMPKATLQRSTHFQWLIHNFSQGFGARQISLDASQPWLYFWTIQSFALLGADLDPENKQRSIDTVMACQHPEGGFGGGPGQFAHLMPTYAAVCALATVGSPGSGGGWDQIDRDKMYKFFMSLKQPDGSFLVSRDSEVDVRGIYCMLCVALLLGILTPELVEGTPEFVASLQTYEGGFANASYAYDYQHQYRAGAAAEAASASMPTSRRTGAAHEPVASASSTVGGFVLPTTGARPPLGEAHGGYTFCALASWVMLRPLLDQLQKQRARHGDYARPRISERRLARWLAMMQGGESELSGFRGRTNKLVDACYAWWVGGSFPLLRALGVGAYCPPVSSGGAGDATRRAGTPSAERSGKEAIDVGAEVKMSVDETEDEFDQWLDVDEGLFDRIGLQKYIIYAAQHPSGGLRDKPTRASDAYHTLYALSGLSTAQHQVSQSKDLYERYCRDWKPRYTNPYIDELSKQVYADALSWKEEEGGSVYTGGADDRVNALHPVFDLTLTHVKAMMRYFYGQG